MRYLMATHRAVMIVLVAIILFIGVTGSLVQAVDVYSIATHAPATDPNMIALRESFNGPPDFEVLAAPDYTAQPLRETADLPALLTRVMASARRAVGDMPLRYVELRMSAGRPTGVLDLNPDLLQIDAVTGAVVSRAAPAKMDPSKQPKSLRNVFKGLHNMGFIGKTGNAISEVAAAGILTLMTTGLIVYIKMLRNRVRIGRSNPFWRSGGWWRTLHRAIAVVSLVFLLVVITSGMLVSFEGLSVAWRTRQEMAANHGHTLPWGGAADASSPLKDAELPGMLVTTIGAARGASPNGPLKVVRLRYFGGMSQGVVVAGNGDDTRQLVFNTATGKAAGETEPGYPDIRLPFGWGGHQLIKSIHRGDFLGLPGRSLAGHVMALLSGLSLVYLSMSGVIMYLDVWKRRRSAGRTKMFWT